MDDPTSRGQFLYTVSDGVSAVYTIIVDIIFCRNLGAWPTLRLSVTISHTLWCRITTSDLDWANGRLWSQVSSGPVSRHKVCCILEFFIQDTK